MTPTLLPPLVACLLLAACKPSRVPSAESHLEAPAAQSQAVLFTERAAEWGLVFEHFNGRSGQRYMVEVLGPGVALFDYDGDGDLDVFLVQGEMLGPGKILAAAIEPPGAGMMPLSDRLYRNDLTRGRAGRLLPHFVDVTASAGLTSSVGYGMGVATGDYDGDGAIDLYVTRFGGHQLWRNRGDGTFEDTTARAGVDNDRFASSATFFDYDRDGALDLFVGHYVDFSYQNHGTCFGPGGALDYCGPGSYRALPSRLFHNRGDGTFGDVTAASGVATAYGPALGVVAADLDGDGWQDLYVANDGAPNQLWINQGNGTFRDDALMAGCAVNAAGAAEAGMGVDAGDFDTDGDLDLFVTHLGGETNTLFVNLGQRTFADGTRVSRLGAPSFPYTGFGTRFFDFDHDSWLDLLVANGAIRDLPALVEKGDSYPLHEPNQLYRNLGDGRFEEISAQAGAALGLSEVSRGAAFGDIDLDGDTDVVLTNNGGPARLLVNEVGAETPWLALRVTRASGADALGAVLLLARGQGGPLLRRMATDGSYLSASDAGVVFGLGREAPAEVSVEIQAEPAPRLRFQGLRPGHSYWVGR